MNPEKRTTLLAALSAAGIGCMPVFNAWAEEYPARPVKALVGFPAGGANDVLGRIIARQLTTAMGQPVVVENVTGAGGTIGAAMVARARPDGYTLLVASVSNVVIAPATLPNVPYDPVKDFTPVIMTASVPLLLAVPGSSPFNSVQDILALARAKPGALNYSSAGIGSAPHLAAALFTQLADLDIVHIPYSGDAPALLALLSKDAAMMFAAAPSIAGRLKSGELKALAVASLRRLPLMPDLPTVSESGVPGHEVVVWHGILAPAGTSADVVRKLHGEIARILALPDVQKQMQGLGFEPAPAGGSPEDFAAFLKADVAKWTAMVRRSGAPAKK